MYFEGIRGQTYTGDIALDDITFSETGCGCKKVILLLILQNISFNKFLHLYLR